MVDFAKLVLPSEEEISGVLKALVRTPQPVGRLIDEVPSDRRPAGFRSLAWPLKIGTLKVCL